VAQKFCRRKNTRCSQSEKVAISMHDVLEGKAKMKNEIFTGIITKQFLHYG
jgi:hypothetical protein